MDPAGRWFEDLPKEGRLDKDDAVFVDVIHTNAGESSEDFYGIRFPCGELFFMRLQFTKHILFQVMPISGLMKVSTNHSAKIVPYASLRSIVLMKRPLGFSSILSKILLVLALLAKMSKESLN